MKARAPRLATQAAMAGEQGETSYIVRVYRRELKRIVGVVEMPLQGWKGSFRSFAELRSILSGACTGTNRFGPQPPDGRKVRQRRVA